MNKETKDHVTYRLSQKLLDEMNEIKEEETMTAALEKAMEMLLEEEKQSNE